MRPQKTKEAVINLRKKGKTFSEIQDSLNIKIPKSTLSYWCKKVVLPYRYYDKIELINIKNREKGRQQAVISNKLKFQELVDTLYKSNSHLSKKTKDKDISKMLLAMLYLGEGTKWKSHSGMILGNSSPDVINLYLHLLTQSYGIDTKKLKCRISFRADQNINALQEYWSKITSIPLKNFYKTKPDPRTVGKITKNADYKGVCVICGGSSKIQLELDAIAKLILWGYSSVG